MTDFQPEIGTALINLLLLSLLFAVAIAVARIRSLFAIVMLSGAYSLVSATWFVLLDAVDVAFTEAAVGAGISTALLLGAMLLTAREAKPEKFLNRLAPMAVTLVVGGILLYATTDLPALGDPFSPVNQGPGAQYLATTPNDMGIPNVVTSVLSSYRGFDTLGEVLVVFTAGIAVALMLGFGERALATSVRQAARSISRPPANPAIRRRAEPEADADAELERDADAPGGDVSGPGGGLR